MSQAHQAELFDQTAALAAAAALEAVPVVPEPPRFDRLVAEIAREYPGWNTEATPDSPPSVKPLGSIPAPGVA